MPAKGQKTGVTFNCEWCGKETYNNLYHYNQTEHHCCSPKCAKDLLHSLRFETRKCEICGKEYECTKISNQRFCSNKCQCEWQKTNVGIKNPRFEGVKVKCMWCNKEYYAKKYSLKAYKHNFCSKECLREWYAKVYSQCDSTRERSRKVILKELSEGKFSFTESAPQLITNELLDKLDIPYENERKFVYYSVDNFLYEKRLIIEVMGDYWHVNPLKFKNGPKTDSQRRIIPRDKAKHTYLSKYHGIECLYLWENDLYNNKYLCELLIELYYANDGVLDDYNSFNYHLDHGALVLNDEIIKPLFLQSKEIEETKEAG